MSDADPQSQSTGRHPVLLWLGIVLAAAGAMVAGFFALNQASAPQITGEILVRTHGGVFTLRPNTCSSHHHAENTPEGHASFFGVDVFDAEVPDRVVRIIEDPALGMVVTVHTPKGMTPVIRGDCDRFDVTLQSTDKQIYGVRGMEGSAAFACDELRGEIAFNSCY